MQREYSKQQPPPDLEPEGASPPLYNSGLHEQPVFDSYPLTPDPYEQQSPDLRSFNTDPREQMRWQALSPVLAQLPGRRRRGRWFWLALTLGVLLSLYGVIGAIGGILGTVRERRFFVVGNHPTIILNDYKGFIDIQAGSSGQVSIVADKEALFGSTSTQIHYTDNTVNDTITITVDPGSSSTILNEHRVEFYLTVPSQTNLEIKTGRGDIIEENVSGIINLSTNSGTISTDSANGAMTFHTDSGSINLEDVNLTGSSTFQTDSGSITFSGSLDRNGTYLFKTDNGSVSLTLPHDVNMQISAKTDSGAIHSDFPDINVQNSYAGGQVIGAVGSAPYAQVTIQTDNGSITLS
jgi:hypothetical protein